MKLKYFLLLIIFAAPCFAQQQEGELSALLGGMVQSDSWIIRKDKLEEEFIGHVHYENDMYKINADKALSKRKEQSYTLEGNVYASRTDADTKAEVSARKIFYNRLRDKGYAQAYKNKQVSLLYKVPGNSFQLYGDRVDFAAKFTDFKITGNAELDDKDNTLYARDMLFNTKTGVFEATGLRPVFWGFNIEGDYALQADKIIADSFNKTIRASGRVQGWVTPAKDFKGLSDNGTSLR